MKKKFLLLIALIILFTPAIFAYARDINEKSMQDFVLAFLDKPMHKAVNEYYGKPKMYDLYEAKIIDIEPFNEGERFSSKIKVQVLTYEGAHNPPYGLETITMVNDFTDIKVVKFEHVGIDFGQQSKK